MTNNIEIRKAIRSDVPSIFHLVHELAVYEKAEHEMWQTEEQYYIDFDEGAFEALVAVDGENIVGTTIYYPSYSTWKGKMFHLEDFVITESYRNKGVGQLLFDAFIEDSKKKGARLVRWLVLDWNEPAIKFYEKQKALIDKDWWHVKLLFESGPKDQA